MRVVIAGAGLVGAGLARRLAAHKHDVVVIDADREVCERVYSQIGVSTIHGQATAISTLEDAELNRAECAAATMRADSDNLSFALLAKHMGVPRTIVRMRDPRYEDAYKLAGVTRVLNIVGLYLHQFVWEIEEPALREIATFGEGKAGIVFVTVSDGSRAAGKTVQAIAQDPDFPTDCVIACLERPDTHQFIIPRGHVTVQAGDRIYLAANGDDIRKAARYLAGK
jgi:trk system potassium uptake protein TrkA